MPQPHGEPAVQLYYSHTKQKHYIVVKPAFRRVYRSREGPGTALTGPQRNERCACPMRRSKAQLVRIQPQSGALEWGAVAGRDTFDDEVRRRARAASVCSWPDLHTGHDRIPLHVQPADTGSGNPHASAAAAGWAVRADRRCRCASTGAPCAACPTPRRRHGRARPLPTHPPAPAPRRPPVQAAALAYLRDGGAKVELLAQGKVPLGYVVLGPVGLLLIAELVRVSATLPGGHEVKTIAQSRWHRIPLQVRARAAAAPARGLYPCLATVAPSRARGMAALGPPAQRETASRRPGQWHHSERSWARHCRPGICALRASTAIRHRRSSERARRRALSLLICAPPPRALAAAAAATGAGPHYPGGHQGGV
jgi:hypothetical protein